MHKLVFFVPEAHLEIVKSAVFAAGAGRMGNYDCCSWQTLGQGQFRPLPGSQPFIGAPVSASSGTKNSPTYQLEHVAEYRVEMVCADECIATALAALLESHPYEVPAYDIWRLVDL